MISDLGLELILKVRVHDWFSRELDKYSSFRDLGLSHMLAAGQGLVPLFQIRYAHKNAGRGSLVRTLTSLRRSSPDVNDAGHLLPAAREKAPKGALHSRAAGQGLEPR